jgi:membrane-associated phospholipid phosphatase
VLALAAAGTWTAIVALSRTYLSAHWLTDVLAGILIGAGWATLWLGILGPRQHVTTAQATVPPAP